MQLSVEAVFEKDPKLKTNVSKLVYKRYFEKLVRENREIEDLIRSIHEDQVTVFLAKLHNLALKGTLVKGLDSFETEFKASISQLVNEAGEHHNNRLELNSLILANPMDDPEVICKSEQRFIDSLSYYKYHGYTEGFEGDLLNSDIA